MFRMIVIYFVISSIIGMFRTPPHNPYNMKNAFQEKDTFKVDFVVSTKMSDF